MDDGTIGTIEVKTKVLFKELRVGEFFRVFIPAMTDKSPLYQKIEEGCLDGIEGGIFNCQTTTHGISHKLCERVRTSGVKSWGFAFVIKQKRGCIKRVYTISINYPSYEKPSSKQCS